MSMNYIPKNSIEFDTMTTIPSWGDPKDFDTDPLLNLEGNKRPVPEYWRITKFFTPDFRVGNLNNNFDDFEFLEDRAALIGVLNFFRGGALQDLAPVASLQVSTSLELSQSRNGIFRKNSNTFNQSIEQKDSSKDSGFLGKLFGKNNKGGSQ